MWVFKVFSLKCMKCKFIIFSCLLLCVLNMYNMLFEYGYISIIIKDRYLNGLVVFVECLKYLFIVK